MSEQTSTNLVDAPLTLEDRFYNNRCLIMDTGYSGHGSEFTMSSLLMTPTGYGIAVTTTPENNEGLVKTVYHWLYPRTIGFQVTWMLADPIGPNPKEKPWIMYNKMTSPTPKHEWNADQKSEIMQCHKLGIIAIANLYDNKFDIVVPSPTINGTAFSSMFTRAGQKIVTQINTAKKLPSNS